MKLYKMVTVLAAVAASHMVFVAPAMAQSTSGAQSGSQANNNINFGGNSTPPASAPGLAIGVGSCARSNSGGFSVGGFGVSIGGTVVDAKCDTRQDMLALHATQQGGTVVRMRACADEDMARAYAAAGAPCPAASHPSARPTYTVPQAVENINDGNPVWDVAQNRWRYR